MATRIQHVVEKMSSTPVIGEPWKFKELPQFCPVPNTILANEKLTLGAKVLWGIIYTHLLPNGRCYLSSEQLASMIGVCARQFRRYSASLKSAGLLRVTQRSGRPAVRELILTADLVGKRPPRVDMNVRGGGHECPGGRSEMSGPSINRDLQLRATTEKTRGRFKKVDPEESEPETIKPRYEWSEEEMIHRGRECGFPDHVIQRDIERMRERKAKEQKERLKKASEVMDASGLATRQ